MLDFVYTDFIVGKDDFSQISVSPTTITNFHRLVHLKSRKIIRYFVLGYLKPRVEHLCEVTLIRKGEKFTPRVHFATREKAPGRRRPVCIQTIQVGDESVELFELKASVDLGDCHETFWKLISYLRNMRELDVPDEAFSLVSRPQEQINKALEELAPAIVKNLLIARVKGIPLTDRDINEILQRRERLQEFERSMKSPELKEEYWQTFFEQNQWIFGFGLNYVILKIVYPQGYAGGIQPSGKGAQKTDYIAVTDANVSFTVIVEIKTPYTKLLRTDATRNGAWGITRDFVDAVAQVQANTDAINRHPKDFADDDDPMKDVYTVTPKGIVVIGNLGEIAAATAKIKTFERFRRSLNNLEILTFDELLQRAQYIVNRR